MAPLLTLRRARSLLSLLDLSPKGAIYPEQEMVDGAGKQRIMVFAPHQDDEVLGCGGTLAKCINAGSDVKVIYMTDGRGGNPRYSPEELIAERRKEAIEGLKVLGCTNWHFLDYPDSELRQNKGSVGRVSSLLDEFRPDMIFVPYPKDNHPDHARTSQIVAAAVAAYSGDLHCYCYEVWSTLTPNVIVDITREVERKSDAIKKHQTQIEIIDYTEKIIGLNAFRSLTANNGIRYCEAFLKCSRQEFVELNHELAGR